jgi:hypothetical protein
MTYVENYMLHQHWSRDKTQHMTLVTHRYSIWRETYGNNSTLKYPSAQASQVHVAVAPPGCHRNCTSMVPSVKRNCMANVLQGLNDTYIIRTKHCVKQFACLNFGGNATGGPGSDNGSWAWLNVSASCSILWLDSSIASADRSSSVTRSTVKQWQGKGLHTAHHITHIKTGTVISHVTGHSILLTNNAANNVLLDILLTPCHDTLYFKHVMWLHQTCVAVISLIATRKQE